MKTVFTFYYHYHQIMIEQYTSSLRFIPQFQFFTIRYFTIRVRDMSSNVLSKDSSISVIRRKGLSPDQIRLDATFSVRYETKLLS